VGPVSSDRMGISGEAIIVAARLADAPLFKEAIRNSRASLGLIVSAFVYESAIRHGRDPGGYSQILVDTKKVSVPAWMKLFDSPLPSSADAA